jgi:hypothetical protein
VILAPGRVFVSKDDGPWELIGTDARIITSGSTWRSVGFTTTGWKWVTARPKHVRRRHAKNRYRRWPK